MGIKAKIGIAGFVFAAFLFICGQPVRAGEGAGAEFTDANCEALSPDLSDLSKFKEKKVSLRGKFKEFRGDLLYLDNCSVKIFLDKDSEDLVKTVFGLGAQKDNVAIFGAVVEHSKYGFVLWAKRIDKTGSDFDILSARIASAAEGNAASLEEAAIWGAEIAKVYPDSRIPPLVEKTFRRAFEIETKDAGTDADLLVATAEKYVKYLGDKAKAVEIYMKAAEISPNYEKVKEGLKKLGCVFYKGKWLTEEEYMKAEGFIFYAGRWMRPVEKKLEDFIAKAKSKIEIPTPLTQGQLKAFIADKKLVSGMKQEEAALSWGYPEDKIERQAGSDIYMMWILKNGSLIFFKNGVVFEWKEGG